MTKPPITWNGTKVEVRARLIPRFLWSTASIDVFLDGECILRTGGQFKAIGSHSSRFTHSGSEHKAELSWGAGIFWSFPYKLRIDDRPVSDARVYVKNWPLSLIPAALLGAPLAVFVHFVLHQAINPSPTPSDTGPGTVQIEKP